ncbi:hypothetical protein SDRG_10008 [Saprolegnia diclina VS20]|uniref:Uncharacterized protein n=1 Tax=Saprolegnia diclina (strain VS20) TaxID=1156394 RepID=T0Q329_SAPDV|nr:hypothetical protein SDRG_10008 [Saprolegnia diclina VS20]EQC32259.1 hypothetical protein SDRG_10008 [Saprolegnia diclina VS20]|eukprot:XP_008614200.1 hypothetical protein SDRG_10008 [Saprolegnia diclina VS20]
MMEIILANIATARFFAPPESPCFSGRTKLTLPIVLHRDLQSLTPPQSLASLDNLKKLRSFKASFAADGEAREAFTKRGPHPRPEAPPGDCRRRTSPRIASCAATARRANEEKGDC